MPSDLLQSPRTYWSLPPAGVWKRWARNFGAAALAPQNEWDATLATTPTGSGSDLWCRALAVEWLLRSWVHKDAPPFPTSLVNCAFPCPTLGGENILPSELAGQRGAATIFLLDVEPSGEPAVALLLAWRDNCKSGPDREVLAPPFGLNGLRFLAIPSRPGITDISGESWHLAAHLLNHFIDSGFEEEKQRLLTEWASSGRIVNSTLERIALPLKKLEHPGLARRTVLLPLANQADAVALAPNLRLRPRIEYAADKASAISLISHRRPKRLAGELPFPLEDVPLMHVLVGGSPAAVLAPIALCRPKKLVLWHSRETKWKALAEAIREALATELAEILKTDANPKVLPLPSDDLAAAWDVLQPVLTADLKHEDFVVFNITSGNRIMGMATLPFAQFEPRLVLVYRDIDAAPYTLTSLHFKGVRPDHATFLPSWADSPDPGVRWDNLFFKPKDRSASVQDIIKLLKNVPENPSPSRLEEEKTAS